MRFSGDTRSWLATGEPVISNADWQFARDVFEEVEGFSDFVDTGRWAAPRTVPDWLGWIAKYVREKCDPTSARVLFRLYVFDTERKAALETTGRIGGKTPGEILYAVEELLTADLNAAEAPISRLTRYWVDRIEKTRAKIYGARGPLLEELKSELQTAEKMLAIVTRQQRVTTRKRGHG
jgi:hypothetical protein